MKNVKLKGIIFFGDSVFFGIGATNRSLGCCRLVKQRLKLPIIISASIKETSIATLALGRLDKAVLKKKQYSHVFLLFGNNDCRIDRNENPLTNRKDFLSTYDQIVKRVLENQQQPIICGLQPINDVLIRKEDAIYTSCFSAHDCQKAYNDICSEVAAKNSIPFISIRQELTDTDIFASEGLHPNDKGHRIIADTLCDYIETNFNKNA